MIVAKNGPAEKAGSIPILLSNNGMPLASVTDTITIIVSARLMEILGQNSPEVKYTRANAAAPSIRASKNAMRNSRHQNRSMFAGRISPVAIP